MRLLRQALLKIDGADHQQAEALLLTNINRLGDWRARSALIGKLGTLLPAGSEAGLAALKVWAKDPDFASRAMPQRLPLLSCRAHNYKALNRQDRSFFSNRVIKNPASSSEAGFFVAV